MNNEYYGYDQIIEYIHEHYSTVSRESREHLEIIDLFVFLQSVFDSHPFTDEQRSEILHNFFGELGRMSLAAIQSITKEILIYLSRRKAARNYYISEFLQFLKMENLERELFELIEERDKIGSHL